MRLLYGSRQRFGKYLWYVRIRSVQRAGDFLRVAANQHHRARVFAVWSSSAPRR